MFQKMFHRVRMWMRPEGPGKTSPMHGRTPWCVSQASDVLEMIQQKSVNRSNRGTLTGGLTICSSSGTLSGGLAIFSRSRCIASETRRTRDVQQKTSTGRI